MIDTTTRYSPPAPRAARCGWLALLAGLAGGPEAVRAQETVVTIVATTDVHGRVMHWDYVNDSEAPWGLARVATVVDSLRRIEREDVVLLDAGDFLQGNPFAAYYGAVDQPAVHPIVDAYNRIGYDAVALGNHEFNWGLDVLERALSAAQFRVVAANVRRLDRGGAPAYRESALFERGGIRIGVVGFTTPGAMVWDGDNLTDRWRVEPIVPAAGRALADLDRQRADLRIAVIHSGLGGPSSYDTTGVGAENVAAQLARLPTPPHLVVVGHSHRSVTDTVIDGVHFVQPRPWAQSLSIVRAILGPSSDGGLVVRDIRAEQLSLAGVPPDDGFVRATSGPHGFVRAWVNATVATAGSGWDATFARAEDTPIVDFVNEVQRRVSGAELSATAALNLEAGFRQGELPRRAVLGLYPYENTLKVVQIDGRTLREFLEHSATYYRRFVPGRPMVATDMPGYDYDMVSGVEYEIDLTQQAGSRIRGLRYDGRPVSNDDVFSLALNSYRAAGGGGYAMIPGLPVLAEIDTGIRDLLVAEAERMQRVETDSYFTRSWRLIPADAAAAVRAEFGGRDVTADRTILRVLVTSDLNGALAPRVTAWSEGRTVGGVAALGGWLDSLERACDCATLRLDAGNNLRGSLLADRESGRPVVEAFNLIGYDAVTLGPTDLAWPRDTLALRAAAANYAWLVAGADESDSLAFVLPWQVRERNGLRIALIGATSAVAAVRGSASTGDAMAAVVTGQLPETRRLEPDLVVVVAQAPVTCETGGACRGDLIDFAAALDSGAVDLIVGGHGDASASQLVNGITVLMPGSYGLSVGVADLVASARGGRQLRTSAETVWADVVRAPAELTAIVARLDDTASREINRLRFPVPLDSAREHAVGRLVADAYRNAARTEIALVENGDIRAGFDGTLVTGREVYAVQPIQHVLVRARLRGDVIERFLERALSSGEPQLHVSGLEVEYDSTRRVGDRVRRLRFSDGRELRDNREYSVAMSPVLARSADDHERDPVVVESIGISDFEALLRYLQRLPGPVEAPGRPRFRAAR